MSTITAALEKIGLRDSQNRRLLQGPGALIVSTASGALIGGLMGRPSLYSGLATTLIGYLTKIPVVTCAGVGMAVSGSYSLFNGTNGVGLSGVKDRFKAMGQDFKYRLYLDKFTKSTTDDTPQVTGLGKVQYFKYPLNGSNLDMSEVEKIQRDLAQSAINYQRSQVNGIYDVPEIAERLY